MNRRKLLKQSLKITALGAGATLFAPLSGCTKTDESDTIQLAFVPKSLNNPVFKITRIGAEQKVSTIGDSVKFRWIGPATTDAAAQSQIIDDLVIQGIQGICVSCNDPDALLPAINRAVEAGVIIVTWDSDSPNSSRLTNISIDQKKAGALAAQLLLKYSPKGPCAVLQGTPGALNLEQRLEGFRSVIDQNPDVEILSIDPCHDDVQRAVEIVEQRINATPGLKSYFFVGMWPFFADLKTMPQLKQFIDNGGSVISLDALEGALRAVKEGYASALVGYSWWQFGQTAVDVLVNKIKNNIDPPDPMYTDLFVVDESNIDVYWEKQISTKGAF